MSTFATSAMTTVFIVCPMPVRQVFGIPIRLDPTIPEGEFRIVGRKHETKDQEATP